MTSTPEQNIYLLSHTHWDREWYVPFEQTRALLVQVMDELLDILETESDFQAFYLDGQSIVIDDYLEIRPHKEATLKKHVQSGRLRIGPWHVASDVVLVSGEALVRNLRYGLRRCREFGDPTMVGYMPDQFGHISQMPQIFQGFGISSAVMGRGRNRGEVPNEFVWESPDGSQVLSLFLNTWYSNARNIPASLEEATAYLTDAAAKAARHATGDNVLLLNGCDHLQADRHAGSIVRRLRDELGWHIQHTGLEEFIAAVRKSGAPLSVWQGELRQDQGGRLDAGTVSARMPLKVDNFRLLSFLEGTLEPICAFVAALGGQPDRDLLDHVWRHAMQNHPHDSICGCSIDEVAREMTIRTAKTQTLAESLAASELRRLGTLLQPAGVAAAARIPADATTSEALSPGCLMYIPAGLPSGWVHIATIDVPTAHSSRSPVRMVPNPERYQDALAPTLTTSDGRALPLQTLSYEGTERLCLDASHLPETQPVHRFQVAFVMESTGPTVTYLGTKADNATSCTEPSIVVGATSLENEHLRMDVAADGTLNVLHKGSGRLYTGLCAFEDGGDAGDTYHFVKPIGDQAIRGSGLWSAAVVTDGPLLGGIVIRRTLRVPAALANRRTARSSDLVDIDIELRIQLRRGSPFLECATTIMNRAQDHRLRVLFPTRLQTSTMRSLSAFDAVDRPLQPDPSWERAESCRPQLGWTSLSDGDATLTVLSRDLPEVEAVPASDGVMLALTLLRCVGAVSRRTSTPKVLLAPEAQLLGEHTFSFAIYPHTTNSAAAELTPDQALALFTSNPLLVPADTIAGCELAQHRTLVETDQSSFVITAMEPASPEFGGSGVVVRGWNASSEPLSVQLRFGVPIAPVAYQTDLAGNRLCQITVKQQETVDGGKATITFNAGPKEMVSVLAPAGS